MLLILTAIDKACLTPWLSLRKRSAAGRGAHVSAMWAFSICLFFGLSCVFAPPASALDGDAAQVKIYINPDIASYKIHKAALLPFAGYAVPPSVREMVEGMFYSGLFRTGKYGLLPRRQAADGASDITDNRQIMRYTKAVQIGKRLQADGVITGSVSYGSVREVSFNVRLLAVRDNQVLWSLSVYKRGRAIPARMVNYAIHELLRKWLAVKDRVATGIIPPPIEAVESLSEVELKWKAAPVKGIREYVLYRSEGPNRPFRKLDSFDGDEQEYRYVDNGLEEGEKYHYMYIAYTRNGLQSPPSGTVRAGMNTVPSTPRGFNALSGLPRKVILSWKANPEAELEGYKVYRSRMAEERGQVLARLSSRKAERYEDRELEDGTSYFYAISAYYDDRHESLLSETIEAVTKAAPVPPRELTAKSGLVQMVELSWAPNPEKDITNYILWRRAGNGGDYHKIASLGPQRLSGYIDKGLDHGQIVHYKLQAVDSDGLTSDFSLPATAVTRKLPAVVKGLRASGSGEGIKLSWQAAPEEEGVVAYNIYRKTWLGAKKIGAAAVTEYIDKDVDRGDTYEYYVTAENNDGLESPPCPLISAAAD